MSRNKITRQVVEKILKFKTSPVWVGQIKDDMKELDLTIGV